jgi:Neuraminidase (sialidase)
MSDSTVYKNVLLPPGPDNPRNSEGAFLKLADGRLLLAYSHFHGAEDRDDSPSDIVTHTSTDGGVTWTPQDELLVANVGMNTMSVSLLRLQDGRAALEYLLRLEHADGTQEIRSLMRFSEDEAATWSEPVCCSGEPSYYVVNNDRLVQLASGRIVIPAADHKFFNGSSIGSGDCVCFLSDDAGATWRHGAFVPQPDPDQPISFQEPLVVELRDGRLLMLIRNATGRLYRSWSRDGGETWSTAGPTDLLSPVSPATCKRLPATGDLLIVYNDHSNISEEYAGKRTPLVTRISQDEGETWVTPRVLEDDPGGWYCYTAVHCEGEHVLLSYCAGQRATGGLNTTQVTRVPVGWLYGE